MIWQTVSDWRLKLLRWMVWKCRCLFPGWYSKWKVVSSTSRQSLPHQWARPTWRFIECCPKMPNEISPSLSPVFGNNCLSGTKCQNRLYSRFNQGLSLSAGCSQKEQHNCRMFLTVALISSRGCWRCIICSFSLWFTTMLTCIMHYMVCQHPSLLPWWMTIIFFYYHIPFKKPSYNTALGF